MKLFSLLCILIGTILILLGFSNRKRKPNKGEKTTNGTVLEFNIVSENNLFYTKYVALIKAGIKKYTIEAYSMPWLQKGEEVLIQITGKQKILGNERLKNKSKLELFTGFLIIIFPFVLLFAK